MESRFEAPWLALKVQFAVGLQIEDEGPKGFGLVLTVSGGKDAGIGAFIIFGSVTLMIGPWKTASHTAGTPRSTVKLGFKIHVFYIFHFGADISVDVAFLGRHPFSAIVTAQIHIDTPWFLPDVTFRSSSPSARRSRSSNEMSTRRSARAARAARHRQARPARAAARPTAQRRQRATRARFTRSTASPP